MFEGGRGAAPDQSPARPKTRINFSIGPIRALAGVRGSPLRTGLLRRSLAPNLFEPVGETAQPGEHVLEGGLHYQACDSNSCMPPHTIPVTVTVVAQ